jgi:aspartate kinase
MADQFKVCKFGGTSLATREQFEKVIDLVLRNNKRKYVIVSAPGKKDKDDVKVTDLLLRAAGESIKVSRNRMFHYTELVIKRFQDILPECPEVIEELSSELAARVVRKGLINYRDSVAAFGEYASARIFHELLVLKKMNSKLFDPKGLEFRVIKSGKNVWPDLSSCKDISRHLSGFKGIAVIPGFYGYENGTLWTLPRGGSDTSAAVIARAVGAGVYENWTDENGLRRANPKVVDNPERIDEISYEEVRELSYLDFKLNSAALMPLVGTNIPVRVLNTNNPKDQGTLIVETRYPRDNERVIVGVTSKKGYVPLNLYKMGMNEEIGFGARVFNVLKKHKISYEHSPTGIDMMSVPIRREDIVKDGKVNNLERDLKIACGNPDISFGDNMAYLGVAGLGIRGNVAAAQMGVLTALYERGIEPRMSSMCDRDISFFFAVDEDRADDAVRAVYDKFFRK